MDGVGAGSGALLGVGAGAGTGAGAAAAEPVRAAVGAGCGSGTSFARAGLAPWPWVTGGAKAAFWRPLVDASPLEAATVALGSGAGRAEPEAAAPVVLDEPQTK